MVLVHNILATLFAGDFYFIIFPCRWLTVTDWIRRVGFFIFYFIVDLIIWILIVLDVDCLDVDCLDLFRAVAAYRSKGRLPAVTWMDPTTKAVLARSAQPLSGLGGKS